MHLFDIEKGFWGGWGLVGQQVPLATGIAFGQKYRKTGGVTMAFFGDGALQQGAIHEAFNMASVWDIPIVFVLENNKFGMGTALERVSSILPANEMSNTYNFDNAVVDGMDVLATHDAMRSAVETVRETSRPFFLEVRCSRFRGHSMSDPGKYRTKDDLAEEKAQDPIPKLATFLHEKGYATEDELKEMDKGIKAEMKEVLKKAEAAPWPDEELIYKYVYSTPVS
jgi:pyruvate dehydrogenase E1 component alpha subunit